MTQKMTSEEIEQRLNKMSEEVYSTGYLAGIKSVLPFVKDLQDRAEKLTSSLEDYLRTNDPNYEQTLEEVAKEVSEKTEELRKIKENEKS